MTTLTGSAARDNFLFHVKALSRVFRGKFLAALQQALTEGRLQLPGPAASLATPEGFSSLIQSLRKKDWNVYAKKPFSSPQKVLDYLGRYTHRVAISNHRLLSVENGQVTFTYRDRKNGNTLKSLTLAAEEFIRRFLLHVLPYGLHAHSPLWFPRQPLQETESLPLPSTAGIGRAASPIQLQSPCWS